jgi:hypothetical protein
MIWQETKIKELFKTKFRIDDGGGIGQPRRLPLLAAKTLMDSSWNPSLCLPLLSDDKCNAQKSPLFHFFLHNVNAICSSLLAAFFPYQTMSRVILYFKCFHVGEKAKQRSLSVHSTTSTINNAFSGTSQPKKIVKNGSECN